MRTVTNPTLPRRRIAALSVIFAGAFATGSAAACDVWRDESGFYRGNCDLRVEFKDKYRLSMEFTAIFQPRYHLKLPNLHPRKFKYFVSGSDVEISVDVEDLGDLPSAAADVAVMINFIDPLTGNSMPTTSYVARTMTIQPAHSERVLITHVQLPNTLQDWDIFAAVMVDPPTPAQPVWGAVVESDEMDNGLMHTCRVYGPNPDTTLEACN